MLWLRDERAKRQMMLKSRLNSLAKKRIGAEEPGTIPRKRRSHVQNGPITVIDLTDTADSDSNDNAATETSNVSSTTSNGDGVTVTEITPLKDDDNLDNCNEQESTAERELHSTVSTSKTAKEEKFNEGIFLKDENSFIGAVSTDEEVVSDIPVNLSTKTEIVQLSVADALPLDLSNEANS